MPPRRRYTNQDYLEMVLCYRECNHVTVRAANLYHQRFGVHVSDHAILDAVYRFREQGRFDLPPVDAGRPRPTANSEEEVRNFSASSHGEYQGCCSKQYSANPIPMCGSCWNVKDCTRFTSRKCKNQCHKIRSPKPVISVMESLLQLYYRR